MNPQPQQEQPVFTIPDPNAGRGGWKLPALFVAVLALAGTNVYQFMQMDKIRTEMGQTKESLLQEIATAKETSAVSAQTAQKRAEQLQAELAAARATAASAVGSARTEALKHADEVAAKLHAEQQKASAALKGEISQVSAANAETSAKVGEVKTEVGNVKTEVDTTKAELEKTVANLKRVQGDLGDQGSLIATNGKELAALRQLGERNYTEFKLAKTKDPQKVGDIQLLLKKADPKKNRFTVEVRVDDKAVEKRDKTINEPVQFLTSRARQPYEIVVNDVKKDFIAGYLSTPKVLSGR
jgi:chromosome segregation ATPase